MDAAARRVFAERACIRSHISKIKQVVVPWTSKRPLPSVTRSSAVPTRRPRLITVPSAVPLPFIVEFKIYVGECGGLKAAAHEELTILFRKPPAPTPQIGISGETDAAADCARNHHTPTDAPSFPASR